MLVLSYSALNSGFRLLPPQVAGIYTHLEGGCIKRSTLVHGFGGADASGNVITIILRTETPRACCHALNYSRLCAALDSFLCMVPAECKELGNSTAYIRTAINEPGWEQPGAYNYLQCNANSSTSDECDPGQEQVRSNTYSFLVVFAAQLLALVVSKLILMYKMRRIVDENNQRRREGWGSMLQEASRGQRSVEAFVLREEDLKNCQTEPRTRDVKTRVKGAVRAISFARRLGEEAKQAESVDTVLLEVTEAVAEHWKQIRWFYCAIVMGTMCVLSADDQSLHNALCN